MCIRDRLKSVSVKYTGNMYIVLIGIEAQTDVHYAMPVSYTHLDVYKRQADVRATLVEWQTSWMKDYGVGYFRVDTVKHVDSTTWAALKNSTTKVNSSFKMIGEYFGEMCIRDRHTSGHKRYV